MKELINLHNKNKIKIQNRLKDFKTLNEKDYFNEFLFCTLTPQSNAKKCWEAVQEINKLKEINKQSLINILKSKTRFHNNKSRYIIENKNLWTEVLNQIKSSKSKEELRNWIADNVSGYGLKEAGHFLRNIGKSENKIAILDRHILRNLKELSIIKEDKIKSKKDYLEIEKKFLSFSEKINIPIDELDLLFWSKENGEIFK